LTLKFSISTLISISNQHALTFPFIFSDCVYHSRPSSQGNIYPGAEYLAIQYYTSNRAVPV